MNAPAITPAELRALIRRLASAATDINKTLQLANPIPTGPEMTVESYQEAIKMVAPEILSADPLNASTKDVLAELKVGPERWSETEKRKSRFQRNFTEDFARRWLPHLNGNALKVFLAIMFAHDFNENGTPNTRSNKMISEFTGIPYKKIDVYTGELKQIGLITNEISSYLKKVEGVPGMPRAKRPVSVNNWTINWSAMPPIDPRE